MRDDTLTRKTRWGGTIIKGLHREHTHTHTHTEREREREREEEG